MTGQFSVEEALALLQVESIANEDNGVAQQMATVPARNRVKHLQDLINRNCGIQISKYMCNRLLDIWGN